MADKLDFSYQVLQTTVRVLYADITRLEVDALVSTDDVHLSRAEPTGVATAIRAAAGDLPRDDARKHLLPAPLGSVLVTSAGRLSAKYIFHASTFEFGSRAEPDALVPPVVQRVIELAAALRIERLAMPVLTFGRSKALKAQIITTMLRSLSCELLAQPHSLREVTIALYKGGSADHVLAEQKRFDDLLTVRDQIVGWSAATVKINGRLALLQQLLLATAGDAEQRELCGVLEARVAADRGALYHLFGCPERPDAAPASRAADRHDDAPRSRPEYELAQRQLTTLLADLAEEEEHLSELRRTEKRRLHSLERQRAQKGIDTAPEVITEIEDITRTLEQRERQIQQIKEQHAAAQRDLQALQHSWQLRQSSGSAA
jgi:O-acetyl-ADP-ribose deacetylase (regulator of RNase III)